MASAMRDCPHMMHGAGVTTLAAVGAHALEQCKAGGCRFSSNLNGQVFHMHVVAAYAAAHGSTNERIE
ncbi:hypothetical protein G6F65_022682 [Rhizopus arrhizus]|nr:hypothetical protein G6F31_021840 [Rhizopus arrhizus]KAG1243023.1 hypothetical protein G6F65_022682 [Rhizopus arrhizus]KAG1362883.1 hypothetical protein G6F59_019014 [Rhizopus arrhizus]